MTRDEAVVRIQRGLGFRSDLSDEIVDALKEAQRLLEAGRTLPSFLISEDQTLTATADFLEINLPAGFIREAEEGKLRYVDSSTNDNVFIEKLTLDEAVEKYTGSGSDADAGKPRAYVIRTKTIQVYPERDIAYNLTWSYYKRAAVLTTNVENAWLEEAPAAGTALGGAEALIGRAGMIIALDLNHKEALAKFQAMLAEAWAGRFAYDIERELVGDPIRVGGRL